jgi:hypothetical protein
MNLQAYAKHRKEQGLRGTSHVAVLKAIESGRLTEPAVRKVDGRWHIDATLADQQWAGNTDPRGALPPPPSPIDTRQPHPAGGGPSLAEAKRAKAIYEAELTRIELQRTKKELISADEVRQEASRLGRQVRDLLLIIPGRNAAKLATMQDSQAISDLLEAEITNALRGLQDEAA